MTTSLLPIAARAYTVRTDTEAPAHTEGPRPWCGWPETVLILDTETTTDPTQRLTFGSYRYCRRTDDGTLQCIEEGLFYADELPQTDPEGFARLKECVSTHRADVAPGEQGALQLRSRREFVDKVFWPVAYKSRSLVVGFNLPFDLSRLAVGCGEARGRFRGGFSLVLWDYWDVETGRYRENRHRPRICVKSLDSKRSFIGFTKPAMVDREDQIPEDSDDGAPDARYTFRGHFLDLRTLTFAGTNESHSLASACKAFGVEHAKETADGHGRITPEYVDYNRRDVLATQELLEKLRAEFDRHPINLDPCKAYSPASVAKAYLRAMGVSLPQIDGKMGRGELFGICMTAYFGGRAECRIRRAIVPVVYVDFLSMYPTVNTLMRLWRLLTAESLDVVDATEEVRRLLAGVTPEGCFDPKLWPKVTFFAQIEPDGDVLPVRARYDLDVNRLNIGVNPLTSRWPLWYAGPDLVGSTQLTGKPPKILRAIRFKPRGRRKGLRTVRLRGRIAVDPRKQDFFRTVIEARRHLLHSDDLAPEERERLTAFLKVLANSGSYGIFAQMNPEELPQSKEAEVTVFGRDGAFSCHTHAPETPGPFCFPPIAALVAAAARLMLALLERCVTDARGAYAFCDTDSMAIVATESGGLVPCPGGPETSPDGVSAVRALSWADVDALVNRFAKLNPYDPTVVPGSILKIEDENFADGQREQLYVYVVAAKRYALFNLAPDGTISLRKTSEHGLGHLLNPSDPEDASRDWIRELWAYLVADALGQPLQVPSWLDRPAISRLTVSSPRQLRPFASLRRAKAYPDQIKPFNFILSAHVAAFGHPDGVNPAKFHLIALYTSDPRQWTKIRWTDLHPPGRRYSITTTGEPSKTRVRVKSYRDVLEAYPVHPEPKSSAPDGSPCSRETVGLLARRPVQVLWVDYIGKESNRLEDVEHGMVHDLGDVLESYVDPNADPWHAVIVSILRKIPVAELKRLTGLSERHLIAIRNEHARPSPAMREMLARVAVEYSERLGKFRLQ